METTNTTRTPTLTPCTCGEAHPHPVANRRTADGAALVFWSDGGVSSRGGYLARDLPESVLWHVANNVTVYDFADVPTLIEGSLVVAPALVAPAGVEVVTATFGPLDTEKNRKRLAYSAEHAGCWVNDWPCGSSCPMGEHSGEARVVHLAGTSIGAGS